MGSEHKHRVKYVLEMNARHWWGGRVVYTLIGTGSSQQAGELLIHLEDGGLWSVNYAGVYRMIATPLSPAPSEAGSGGRNTAHEH